jgi:hypothetical protein
MMEDNNLQLELHDSSGATPAELWDAEAKKRALDELFSAAKTYRSAKDYLELLSFLRKFRRYSPYNGMLVHIQKPGARYVLRASEWQEKYGRSVRPGAQPLVALQPMGPVMFLFDVSDTEGGTQLPPEIEAPFEPARGVVGKQLDYTLENCRRDGIRVQRVKQGSQRAGSIQRAVSTPGVSGFKTVKFREVLIRVDYELLINDALSSEAQYATLVHELGHLYCGHLGTRHPDRWPDRQGLNLAAREFEAESVSYLVCKRLGIDTPSDEYLNGYLSSSAEIPSISLDRVVVVSGLIEAMGSRVLASRKQRAKQP